LKKRIGIVSLGCPKNLVDSEIMLGLLKKQEFEITPDKDQAEVIIVNTCGFIETAKQESIDTILEMAEAKKKKCEILIVTGCMAERYREQILQQIPEVDAVLGTGNYGEIAEIIQKAYGGEKSVAYGKLEEKAYLENERVLTTGKGYAYLKIAEGCDNCCTYCIIPALRGHYRSRRLEDITAEAERLAQIGIREVILVAQDTTRYGMDLYKERKLVELIRQISTISGIEWIRLLYCYPEEIDSALIHEIADNPKVVKYLDIPIQHASDRVLKRMGRRGTSTEIRKLLTELKTRIPGINLRTSLIVGFPGEEEEDFTALSEFVKEMQFDRLGVFTYSKEEDTPAAGFPQQVSKSVKEKRQKSLMLQQQEIMLQKNRLRLGHQYKAIVEGVADDGIFYYGRTYAEAPDIDGLVYFTSPEPLQAGEFVEVRILNTDDYDLIGEALYESAE
jgi:ribosomal protein S12 methylthiotransferase